MIRALLLVLFFSSAITVAQPALAQDAMLAEGLPQPQREGEITYITGGIGEEERSAVEAFRPEYNLHLMSATRDGHFEGDTHITLLDASGKELLNVPAGPLFYAKLAPGRYIVKGASGEKTKEQAITIRAGKPVRVHFSW